MMRLTVWLALLLFAPLASSQTRERIPPPEFERETVVDDAGLQQWAEYKVKCEPCGGRGKNTCAGCKGLEEVIPNCTECGGTRIAPCRTCGGGKILPDPLVEMSCPFCRGSGWYNCAQCKGAGTYNTTDQLGNKNSLVCRACDKKGRYECSACEGDRLLPTLRLKKKNAGEAKAKDLVKLRSSLRECLEALQAFEPLERGFKSLDAYEAIMKSYGKKLPPLKASVDQLEIVLKGLRKVAAAYQGYEAKNTFEVLVIKDRTVYLLQYNLRVLDQSVARLEFNATVDGDK